MGRSVKILLGDTSEKLQNMPKSLQRWAKQLWKTSVMKVNRFLPIKKLKNVPESSVRTPH